MRIIHAYVDQSYRLLTLTSLKRPPPQKIRLLYINTKAQARGPRRDVIVKIIAPMSVTFLHSAGVHGQESSWAKAVIGAACKERIIQRGQRFLLNNQFIAMLTNVAEPVDSKRVVTEAVSG